jgi:hypothetical protein
MTAVSPRRRPPMSEEARAGAVDTAGRVIECVHQFVARDEVGRGFQSRNVIEARERARKRDTSDSVNSDGSRSVSSRCK